LRDFRSKLFRVLQLVIPKGSSLDAIFDSYDDWRKVREKSSASRASERVPSVSPAPEADPKPKRQWVAHLDDNQGAASRGYGRGVVGLVWSRNWNVV